MNDEKKHASLGDLPAWSSPMTVREIAEGVYADDPITRLRRTKDNSSSVTLEGKEVPGEC